MEIWFVSALAGALFAGLSNFYFKQAATRNYNAELFTLYGSLISVPLVLLFLYMFSQPLFVHQWVLGLVFVGGFIAATTNIFKVHALRFIDSTIYFPLFKLLAPAIAIVVGVVFFSESFTYVEWFGLILGLIVPLLLITKVESTRQNNLLLGLVLVLVTGVASATTASLNKLATEEGVLFVTILFWTNFGVVFGSIILAIYKKGTSKLLELIKTETSVGLILAGGLRSTLVTVALGFMLYAFAHGGTLAVVQTVHSMYILIPIVLSIIFYNEHWNLQKAVAVILSVAALALLG
ncbi:DMT family transporter [Candidatus Nomurabacteria bacterium]|nr:DMT family transporter [Candidatus Nomurabacteria bacterium]